MHVAQISFFRDPSRTATDILRDWWVLVDCAEMVARTGASVSVIQACSESQAVTRNGVSYHFLGPGPGAAGMVRSPAFAELLRKLQADVFHVNGLGFAAETRMLAQLAPATPIFIQDHADSVPRPWRRPALRRGLAVAAGISFCALEQAGPFVSAGLLDPQAALFEIPECSTRFTPGDRDRARRATAVHGDPAVLWVGHLNANKDPLTVLSGVSRAVKHLPDIQLWCCFGVAPLLAQVKARIDRDPLLRGRVHLLGKVPHARIEQLMRAADLFVLASRNEGSGCSLIEALACGLPPVVTGIPSFRALTSGGSVGTVWPCGDADALCGSLVALSRRPRTASREAVRAHFERELSFQAVGAKLVAGYEAAMRSKSGAGPQLRFSRAR